MLSFEQANDMVRATAAYALHKAKEASKLRRRTPQYRNTWLQVRHALSGLFPRDIAGEGKI